MVDRKASAVMESGQGAEASKTDWGMIHTVVAGGAESEEAWERFARRYWPAIYAYVRSIGRTPDEAADLTQGFVCDVLLGKGLVERADPERGRFRTFLLAALRNFVAEKHRYDTRQRRSPDRGAGQRIVPLDHAAIERCALSSGTDPETAFVTQWSTALLHRVLDAVRDDCVREELEAHWCVFELRTVRPLLFGEPPVPYATLVNRLDLKDAAQATNMMVTVKRRFARAVYAEVGRTVQDPGEISEEIQELLRALERSR